MDKVINEENEVRNEVRNEAKPYRLSLDQRSTIKSSRSFIYIDDFSNAIFKAINLKKQKEQRKQEEQREKQQEKPEACEAQLY